MFDRILVPLDGSPFGERALPAAAELARRSGGALDIVHVHEPHVGPVYPDGVPVLDPRWDSALREQEQEYLRAAAGRCMEQHGIAPRTELLEGAVASAIRRYADEVDADLIVMTTHGRGGISRAWVGSVADALVRSIGVPVLLLRPVDGQPAAAPALRHLLVPVDGSELSEDVLPHALALARLHDARTTLLRVVLPLPFVVGPAAPAVPVYDHDAAEQSRQLAQQHLDELARRLAAEGVEVDADVVIHATPAVAILDYAAANAVDGIAMATHGRGGWSRIALGSVADKVMRGSHIPTLLYRPAGVRDEADQREAAESEDTTCLSR